MLKPFFTHLINPVGPFENKSLFTAQRFTIESILKARNYAAHEGIAVQSIACFAKGNNLELPPDFTLVPSTERLSSDTLETKKRVPFFNDLLKRLYEHAEGEYLIYTNLDICLMPNFYTSVKALLDRGHDAIIINRRLISCEHLLHASLDRMYADLGKVHTGYDTFIFKKSLFQKFILRDICIGVPPVGNDLFYNFFIFAENPVLETNLHLTFHIGEELIKRWGDRAILCSNQKEFKKLLHEVGPLMRIEKFPGANKPFLKRHFKWLMNPTVSYPLMALTDIRQLFHKRKPRLKPEVPGLLHRYYEWMIKKINLE